MPSISQTVFCRNYNIRFIKAYPSKSGAFCHETTANNNSLCCGALLANSDLTIDWLKSVGVWAVVWRLQHRHSVHTRSTEVAGQFRVMSSHYLIARNNRPAWANCDVFSRSSLRPPSETIYQTDLDHSPLHFTRGLRHHHPPYQRDGLQHVSLKCIKRTVYKSSHTTRIHILRQNDILWIAIILSIPRLFNQSTLWVVDLLLSACWSRWISRQNPIELIAFLSTREIF